MPDQNADRIYQLVRGGFEQLGAANPDAIRRVLLLRDRSLVGHRYLCERFQAIRLLGEETVEFYDDQGRHLKTVGLEPPPMKKAA